MVENAINRAAETDPLKTWLAGGAALDLSTNVDSS
jgi:hypothetical protein